MTSNSEMNDTPLNSLLSDKEDLQGLIDKIEFSPQHGRIMFGPDPISIMHKSGLVGLHREVLEHLGSRETARFFALLGFESGQRDAKFITDQFSNQKLDKIFDSIIHLRVVRGFIKMKTCELKVNLKQHHFLHEVVFSGNFEVDTVLQNEGLSKSPSCWGQVGYATGYATALLNRPAIYKEVECGSTGNSQCKMIGKLADDWRPEEIATELECLPINKIFGNLSHPVLINQSRKTRRTDRREKSPPDNPGGIIGVSSAITRVFEKVAKVAKAKSPILFLGETGVGKERFARLVHEMSNRANQPFIPINCAAIPSELVESELFGVEKGAFTGADHSRPGRFERANNGTLFLDEVGDLPWETQTKLLRVLQEQEIERVGGVGSINVDVRIVAATNSNLESAISEGYFRSDLYYRLNIFPLTIPPLRDRKDDIPLLVDHFINRFNTEHRRNITGITQIALQRLLTYRFPGNIRELENIIERALILTEDYTNIDLGHLPYVEDKAMSLELGPPPEEESTYDNLFNELVGNDKTLTDIGKEFLGQAVEKNNGNMTQAAKSVGLTRMQVAYRLKE